MPTPARVLAIGLAAGALAGGSGPALGQSVLDRTPNLSGAWAGRPGVLHFNFLHRFNNTGAPQRKVTNSPTFLLAAGLPHGLLAGVTYATSSTVAPGLPNEWEPFGRWAALSAESGAPVDLAVQAAYNQAAESVDGELSLARRLGPVRLLAAARAFSDGYGAGQARYAVAAGASVRLGRYLALAGDFGSLLDRADGEEPAWGAALQVAIPYTPHTLSLHAANTATGTLQGSSRGGERVSYGFEFTIPVTLSRYFGASSPPVVAAEPADTAFASEAGGVVQATMRQLAYAPARIEIAAGTTVEWRNEDPVPHTVTADDGGWDSGEIAPGAAWRRTFDRPGTYPFHCTPHPFMTGVVVVR